MSCTKSKTFSRRNNFCFINFLIKALVSEINFLKPKKSIWQKYSFTNNVPKYETMYIQIYKVYKVNANLQVSGHTVLDHFLTFVENTISY